MKTIILTALALSPLGLAAATELENGQFEINALYGRTDSKLDDTNFYGASAAGGYYFGNHLLQLEVGVLLSENLGSHTELGATNPANSAQTFDFYGKRTELQDIPIWVNYRYGVSFGPADRIRLEAGPVLGARVRTFREKYNLTIHETGLPDRTSSGASEQSGKVVFDYGLAAAMRVRLTDSWSIHAGYRYLRSTSASFESRVRQLDSGNTYVYYPVRLPEHGTHYASFGVEYLF